MLRAAEDRYRTAARLAATAASLARKAWRAVPEGAINTWDSTRLVRQIAVLQVNLAHSADAYLASVLAEQDLDAEAVGSVNAAAFAGVAGDGRSLSGLFDEPHIQALVHIGDGLGAAEALAMSGRTLELMAVTAVQDAGRAADSVAMVARPQVGGYVRMLNTPSCARCVILAGKFFRWNSGFARHPRCDCRHVPSNEDVAGDLRTNPMGAFRAGQVRGLSRADMQAIRDGADIGQVVNAQRGMYEARVFGRDIKGTTEGITKRGLAGVRLGNFEQNVARNEGQRYRRSQVPRLRPESIYDIAGDDRDEALRLLRRFGYLI